MQWQSGISNQEAKTRGSWLAGERPEGACEGSEERERADDGGVGVGCEREDGGSRLDLGGVG